MSILIDNIKNSKILSKPYKHNLFKLFDEEMSDKLIENFYFLKDYFKKSKKVKDTKKISNISSSRFMIIISGNTLNGIYDDDNYKIVKNIEPLNTVLHAYSNKVIKIIYEKYNTPKKRIDYKINLVYDVKNYTIGPHTDSPRRAATIVTYIVPKKDIGKKLGLWLYKDQINRHKSIWRKIHYSFDNFKRYKQIEYYSGSSISFDVNKNSFHGVEKIDVDCDRMSIQVLIEKYTDE